MDLKLWLTLVPGTDLASGRPGAQLKLGITETMICTAQQQSRIFVGMYIISEKYKIETVW